MNNAQGQAVEITPIKTIPNNKRVDRKIDVARAIQLRLKNNLTFQDIADKFGVSRQAVHKKIKGFIKLIADPTATKAYSNHKIDLLTSMERVMLLKMVDTDKLKEASLNNIAYAFTQIHNANRLEKGEATVIRGYDDLDVNDKELDGEVKRLCLELGEDVIDLDPEEYTELEGESEGSETL